MGIGIDQRMMAGDQQPGSAARSMPTRAARSRSPWTS
jgi:hypothetical protein